jgi:hypothetical protein
MDEYFAATSLTNATVLCVGAITRKETEAARGDGLDVDGTGYYLFLADEGAPDEPIQLVGKIFSPLHAERLSRLFERGPD